MIAKHNSIRLQQMFDQAWHRSALAGEPQAIDQLASRSIEPLYRFCYYRVGCNVHICEDVVQDTLVRAIRELGAYDPARARGDVLPWLIGLARNEIRRALANERTAVSLNSFWAHIDEELRDVFRQLESEPLNDAVLQRVETSEMVGATMAQLPSHYRETLEAKYVEGKSVRDIAASRKTTEKAVESQLSRARKAFRATFLTLAQNLNWEGSG